MQKNKIIRATTAKVPCDKKTYVILPRLNGVLFFEGRKTKFIEAEEFVDISKAPEVFWDQDNFPHLSDVFSKVDIMHELYKEPIVYIKTNDFAIENSEILFGDVEIGFISNFVKIYRKFQRTLLILSIVLVSFLLIYIIYLCRKPIESIGKRVILKPIRNNFKEVYVATTEYTQQLTAPSAPSAQLLTLTVDLTELERSVNLLRTYIK